MEICNETDFNEIDLLDEISIPRIHAMISQCKNRGGSCNCRSGCKAATAAQLAISRKKDDLKQAELAFQRAEALLVHLESPPLTFTEGFVPDPAKQYVVYMDGEDSDFGHLDADGEFVSDEIWPFDPEWIFADDCKKLGLIVE